MGSYLRYIAQRTAMFAIAVMVAIAINFVIPRLMPGNPVMAIMARMSSVGARIGYEDLVVEYNQRFGLDKDLPTQFVSYLRELLKGNLGYSIADFPERVDAMIARALPWTLGLLGFATVISWLLGTLIGALVGWWGEESKAAKILVSVSLVLYAIPYYLLAMILVFLIAYTMGIFPISGGFTTGTVPSLSLDFLLDVMRHAALPALSIILVSLGWWILSMRSMIVGLKGEDFVTMAEAKGLSDRRIMLKYAFRNALLPQVTGLALSLGSIFNGALLTEVIFAYPGLGWLLLHAIKGLDYPLIQGIVLLVILSVCLATYILDIIYPLVDPRVRIGGG